MAVYNDGDLGVYKHDDATTKADVDKKRSSTNSTSGGGTKMGETENWDEFLDPDTHEIDKGARIQFGQDWESTIESNVADAKGKSLKEIAANSTLYGKYDLKNSSAAPYGISTGRRLNGKYATARSAGNYLAGYLGATHPQYGVWLSKTTYMKLAGALNTKDWDGHGSWIPFTIIFFGKSYGPSAYYGEIPYSGRRILQGFDQGVKDYPTSKIAENDQK